LFFFCHFFVFFPSAPVKLRENPGGPKIMSSTSSTPQDEAHQLSAAPPKEQLTIERFKNRMWPSLEFIELEK
jgi:hypothetical protein